jgi:formylglycine-generating enzyme required for sulfatase activity
VEVNFNFIIMKKTCIKVAAMAAMMCAVLVSAHAQTDISANIPEIAMVHVEGGTFVMGCTSEQSNCYSREKPKHTVTLSSFNIGKYEVTQAQWQAVMGANPSYFKDCPNCPVENVSWNDVQEFIKKLNSMTGKNYRLPTEAEWEYAVRGGKNYEYSGSRKINAVAWYDDNSGNKTHIVGTKQPNGYGIYDMSGNVWEWCSDWYGSYSSSSQTNPAGPSSGSGRVLRGGGWNNEAAGCRVAYRYGFSPDARYNTCGFRLVLP